MAEKIATAFNIIYHKINIPMKDLVVSALTDQNREIPDSLNAAKDKNGIPYTYVPFRNGIFLSLAAAYGESRGIFNLITGFNVVDTPDYPDTTEVFVTRMEAAINQGTSSSITGQRFRIHAPLIKKTKPEIIQTGLGLGADYSYSISCYRGNEVPCFACPACEIRMKAFKKLHMEDPLVLRLKKEGRL